MLLYNVKEYFSIFSGTIKMYNVVDTKILQKGSEIANRSDNI